MEKPCSPLLSGDTSVGTWRSLVAHSLGVRGVGSSNLPVPTILSFEPFGRSRNGPRTGSTSMEKDNASTPAMPKSEAVSAPRTVYLLWHTDSYGDEKLIGVYTTRSDASLGLGRVKDKPGFSEGGEFEIAEYELNKDHWTDGFVRQEGFSLPKWFRLRDPDH